MIEAIKGKGEKRVEYTDKEVLMNYRIEDLFYSQPTSKYFHGLAAYFLYIFRVAEYLYIAIYMDWSIIFRHPVNFFVLVFFFAISTTLLYVAGFVIMLFSIVKLFHRPPRQTVITSWTKILAGEKSGNNLMDDLKKGMKLLGTMKEAKLLLLDEDEGEDLERLNKLKAILFFSTLVYKRETEVTKKVQGCINKLKSGLKYDEKYDQKIYTEVYETLCKYEKRFNKRESNENVEENIYTFENIGRKIRNTEKNPYTFENIERKIRDMIDKDEETIRKQIKDLNLDFTSVSELNTDDGGSFCGMFWSETENFIVVAFKGTTPTNFAEWLGNLTFQCVDARGYLFGQVHRGFYNYLFPLDEERAGKNYPCQKIIEAINFKATTLKNKNGGKVNLWITGHSLGGALATLFYSRLLNTDYSHEAWELQGAFTFASPAVGDLNFSAQLTSLINDPRNLARPLWRVVLNDDVIPKMPYRACNKDMRKYGYHYNILMNFAQVGDKITFYGGENDPSSIKEFFSGMNNTSNNGGERLNRLKSYCQRYHQKRVKWRSIFKRSIFKSILFPFYIYRITHSHGTGGYFEALIEYENKIRKIVVV